MERMGGRGRKNFPKQPGGQVIYSPNNTQHRFKGECVLLPLLQGVGHFPVGSSCSYRLQENKNCGVKSKKTQNLQCFVQCSQTLMPLGEKQEASQTELFSALCPEGEKIDNPAKMGTKDIYHQDLLFTECSYSYFEFHQLYSSILFLSPSMNDGLWLFLSLRCYGYQYAKVVHFKQDNQISTSMVNCWWPHIYRHGY